MTYVRLNTYAGGLTVLVIALAILNWSFAPEASSSWLAPVITMPVIWVCANFAMKLAVRVKLEGIERRFFTSAVVAAGLLLAFSLAAKLYGTVYDIDPALIKRARNIFAGLVLLYFGNMMPKMIGPVLEAKCSHVAANSVRRFIGWALVLGALGYIGAWAFAPMSQASIIAQTCVGTAVILSGLHIALVIFRK